MLKQRNSDVTNPLLRQPPSGGCVLKLARVYGYGGIFGQPPSGGCVLKLFFPGEDGGQWQPAAFGRLCVETLSNHSIRFATAQPPSGGCVLKPTACGRPPFRRGQPPSGGCVLKLPVVYALGACSTSRLRAAVC